VNTLNRGGIIAVGENSQSGWSQIGKSNYGSGQLFGANIEAGFISTVFDNYIIDNPIRTIEPNIAPQNQTL
jgi:hypothetical protein